MMYFLGVVATKAVACDLMISRLCLLHAVRTYTIPRLFRISNAGFGLGLGLAML